MFVFNVIGLLHFWFTDNSSTIKDFAMHISTFGEIAKRQTKRSGYYKCICCAAKLFKK